MWFISITCDIICVWRNFGIIVNVSQRRGKIDVEDSKAHVNSFEDGRELHQADVWFAIVLEMNSKDGALHKMKDYIKFKLAGYSVIILFVLIMVITWYKVEQKTMNEHYNHAKTNYVRCLKSVNPQLPEVEAEATAENQLKVFKDKNSIVDVDENLTSLVLLVDSNDKNCKITAEMLSRALKTKE